MFKKLFNSIFGTNEQQQVQQYSEPERAQECQPRRVELDPATLHGTHYTLEQFDAEVDKRVQNWIRQEEADGETIHKSDINNIIFNYRREVYQEWTGADNDQAVQWEMKNSMAHRGVATSGFIEEDGDNPLLEPIHGISLRDYAAMTAKLSTGANFEDVCRVMGIEQVVWDEVSLLWTKRMQEDGSFLVTGLYGQYFMEGDSHPKLSQLNAKMSAQTTDNLEKLKTDRYFYEELCGARQAAYEYGLDGAQWILDNYGITLGDFQAVAMKYMTEQNQNWSCEQILHFQNYQESKQKEYAARFAAEQGGNVADDVKF